MADSRVVLMIRGLRSLVTERRRKPRGLEEEEQWSVQMENPPFMTVNTHPDAEHHRWAPPWKGDAVIVGRDRGKSWTRDDGGDSDEPT